MKSVRSILILASFFLSTLHGQDRIVITTPVLFVHQGYVINNGLGFANSTITTAANIATANPATIADFGKTSLGVSLLYASKIDSTLNVIRVGQERLNAWFPQAFGLVLPYQNFRLGLGFNQKYSGSLDVGEIIVTDPGDPGGSEGKTIKPVLETYVYSASANLAYLVPGFISPEHRLFLGLQIDVNFLRDYEKIDRLKAESTDQSITWKAGARYDFLDYLRFGLAYEKGARFEGMVKRNDEALITAGGQQIIGQRIEEKFSGKMPDRLVAGLYFKVAEKLRLANDFTYVYWEKIANNLKNSLEISGNLIYQGWESASLSAGFYSIRREYKDPDFEGDSGLFLSAGVLVSLGRTELEALIADSHLFSSDTRKQTLARLGLGFSL